MRLQWQDVPPHTPGCKAINTTPRRDMQRMVDPLGGPFDKSAACDRASINFLHYHLNIGCDYTDSQALAP
jgi:hypothetical protein